MKGQWRFWGAGVATLLVVGVFFAVFDVPGQIKSLAGTAPRPLFAGPGTLVAVDPRSLVLHRGDAGLSVEPSKRLSGEAMTTFLFPGLRKEGMTGAYQNEFDGQGETVVSWVAEYRDAPAAGTAYSLLSANARCGKAQEMFSSGSCRKDVASLSEASIPGATAASSKGFGEAGETGYAETWAYGNLVGMVAVKRGGSLARLRELSLLQYGRMRAGGSVNPSP